MNLNQWRLADAWRHEKDAASNTGDECPIIPLNECPEVLTGTFVPMSNVISDVSNVSEK